VSQGKRLRGRKLVAQNKTHVIPPDSIYLGKTYGEWVADFVNWLFSVDADKHNNGQVVFLKGISSTVPPDYASGLEPNIMVGKDRLEIFDDQAIFFPCIMAYWSATDPGETEVSLRERVKLDIDGGDNPPTNNQVTIDRQPIDAEMGDHLIQSPQFTLFAPDSEYGKSLKDYVEYPMPTGVFQSVASGYFFLVNLTEGLHIIHSYARGRTTEKGAYWVEFLYEVNVKNALERGQPSKSGLIPEKKTKDLLSKLQNLQKENEIDDVEYETLKNIVGNSRQTLTETMVDRFEAEDLVTNLLPKIQKRLQEKLRAKKAPEVARMSYPELLKWRKEEYDKLLKQLIDSAEKL